MAAIIPLPRRDRAPIDSRGTGDQPAAVHAFPSCRHRRIAATVGRRMAACADIADACAELVAHLQVIADHLERIGVPDEEQDVDLNGFARAAWRVWGDLQHDDGEGVA
jgi:hypothetical protein